MANRHTPLVTSQVGNDRETLRERFKDWKTEYPSFVTRNEVCLSFGKHGLSLPYNFMNNYWRGDAGRFVLRAMDGRSWQGVWGVHWDSVFRMMGIKKGWKRFSLDNKVQTNELCMFEVVSQNCLRVSFPDRTASAQESDPKGVGATAEDCQDSGEEEDQKGSQKALSIHYTRRMPICESKTGADGLKWYKPFISPSPTAKRGSVACKKIVADIWTKSPSFARQPNAHDRMKDLGLGLPSPFVRKFLKGTGEDMAIVDEKGRMYKGHWRYDSNGSNPRLRLAFYDFCQANKLNLGDIIIMELVEPTLFKGWLFKKGSNSDEKKRSGLLLDSNPPASDSDDKGRSANEALAANLPAEESVDLPWSLEEDNDDDESDEDFDVGRGSSQKKARRKSKGREGGSSKARQGVVREVSPSEGSEQQEFQPYIPKTRANYMSLERFGELRTQHPSCVKSAGPWPTKRAGLDLPKAFMVRHFEGLKGKVDVQAQDGTKFPMTWHSPSSDFRAFQLRQGWPVFAKHARLSCFDILLVEVVSTSLLKLSVVEKGKRPRSIKGMKKKKKRIAQMKRQRQQEEEAASGSGHSDGEAAEKVEEAGSEAAVGDTEEQEQEKESERGREREEQDAQTVEAMVGGAGTHLLDRRHIVDVLDGNAALPKCQAEQEDCSHLSMAGFKFCSSHILEDPNAEYAPCPHGGDRASASESEMCGLPVLAVDPQFLYCGRHSLPPSTPSPSPSFSHPLLSSISAHPPLSLLLANSQPAIDHTDLEPPGLPAGDAPTTTPQEEPDIECSDLIGVRNSGNATFFAEISCSSSHWKVLIGEFLTARAAAMAYNRASRFKDGPTAVVNHLPRQQSQAAPPVAGEAGSDHGGSFPAVTKALSKVVKGKRVMRVGAAKYKIKHVQLPAAPEPEPAEESGMAPAVAKSRKVRRGTSESGLKLRGEQRQIELRKRNSPERHNYIGVIPCPFRIRGFQAKIYDKFRDRTQHLGYYESALEAALSYDLTAREMYGSEAELNFPENPRIDSEDDASTDGGEEDAAASPVKVPSKRKYSKEKRVPRSKADEEGPVSVRRGKYKGVTKWRELYRARVRVQDKVECVSGLRTVLEAAVAYDVLAREHGLETSRLNFPNWVPGSIENMPREWREHESKSEGSSDGGTRMEWILQLVQKRKH